MTYITCDHPQDQTIVKQDIERTTDVLVRRSKPYPFCEKCKSRLPIIDEPGRSIVTFFFITQENKTRAVLTA
jgi:hypothetical protein